MDGHRVKVATKLYSVQERKRAADEWIAKARTLLLNDLRLYYYHQFNLMDNGNDGNGTSGVITPQSKLVMDFFEEYHIVVSDGCLISDAVEVGAFKEWKMV